MSSEDESGRRGRGLRRFLVDSGFILALYKNEGEQTTRVRQTFEKIISASESVLVLPWPIMYERLNSEFVENNGWIKRFNFDWSNLKRARKVEYADDAPFREACRKELLGLLPERSGRFKALSLRPNPHGPDRRSLQKYRSSLDPRFGGFQRILFKKTDRDSPLASQFVALPLVIGRDDYSAGVGTLFLECASSLPLFISRDGWLFSPIDPRQD